VRRHYAEHREERIQYARKYYKKHAEENREKNIARVKEWITLNRDRARLQRKKQKIKRRTRIPVWADLEAINEFYKNCPKDCVVDHIIPLNGKHVSGLHVLENLQYLTRSENAKKSNKVDLDKLNDQEKE
jgi:5-methylcytosine-specific restriction endonuclease McrA